MQIYQEIDSRIFCVKCGFCKLYCTCEFAMIDRPTLLVFICRLYLWSVYFVHLLNINVPQNVRSKILTPLETIGRNSCLLEGFEKSLFTIWNFKQGDLHSSGGIQISISSIQRGNKQPGWISESLQWNVNHPK